MCDYPDFYRFTEPVARKNYRCEDCGRVIEKGQKHHAWSGKSDGECFTARICHQCMVLHNFMDKDFGGDDGCSISWGGMEGLREAWMQYCEELPVEVLALSPPAWLKCREEAIERRKNYSSSRW